MNTLRVLPRSRSAHHAVLAHPARRLGLLGADLGRLLPVHARRRASSSAPRRWSKCGWRWARWCCCRSCGATRAQFPLRLWPKLALIGAINSAVPFVLFAWAAQRAPAGVGAISNSMAVLFTALVGVPVLRREDRLAPHDGAAGRASPAWSCWPAARPQARASAGRSPPGTAAAFLYGFGVNLVRRHVTGLPPAAVAAATLGCVGVAGAAVRDRALARRMRSPRRRGARPWALGVLCTGFAFVLYYRLIQRIGPARAATVTYLVPLFAVAWAWLLLGEAVTGPMLASPAR